MTGGFVSAFLFASWVAAAYGVRDEGHIQHHMASRCGAECVAGKWVEALFNGAGDSETVAIAEEDQGIVLSRLTEWKGDKNAYLQVQFPQGIATWRESQFAASECEGVLCACTFDRVEGLNEEDGAVDEEDGAMVECDQETSAFVYAKQDVDEDVEEGDVGRVLRMWSDDEDGTWKFQTQFSSSSPVVASKDLMRVTAKAKVKVLKGRFEASDKFNSDGRSPNYDIVYGLDDTLNASQQWIGIKGIGGASTHFFVEPHTLQVQKKKKAGKN